MGGCVDGCGPGRSSNISSLSGLYGKMGLVEAFLAISWMDKRQVLVLVLSYPAWFRLGTNHPCSIKNIFLETKIILSSL